MGSVPISKLASGLAWVTLCILSWAPLFSVAKRTLPYLDAFTLATVRYLLGVVLFILLLAAVEGWQALRYDGRLLPASVFGLIGITGFNLCVWIGLSFTLPEHASVILALQSPLIALAVWVTRGHRPAAFTLACVVAAICGVLLVVTRGDPIGAIAELGQGGALLGDVLVLAGGIAWVIYGLAGAHFGGWSPLRMTVLTCIPGLAGLLVANLLAIAAGWASLPSVQTLGAVGWQIIYFSVFTVVVGILSFNHAVRRLGPLNTMIMLNITPVLVFGIEAALGRRFAPIELLGAAIVIGALVANNLYLRRSSGNSGSGS
jgi:drug/metabolite transporter (DMT)-like permease